MWGTRGLFYFLLIALSGSSLGSGELRAAEDSRLEGIVRDASGASVPSAEVVASGKDFTQTATTDREGKFQFSSLPASSATITVRSSGFAKAERAWSTQDSTPVEIV